MDAGHNVIDKFSPNGTYLSQITGPFGEGLVGLAVTANGELQVAVRVLPSSSSEESLHEEIDTFDNSATNDLLKQQEGAKSVGHFDPNIEHQSAEDSFTASPTGDYYTLFGCGCAEKFGQALSGLGRVDDGPGDIAMAVDPATGHLYVDDQSSVVEWDTGGLDGYDTLPESLRRRQYGRRSVELRFVTALGRPRPAGRDRRERLERGGLCLRPGGRKGVRVRSTAPGSRSGHGGERDPDGRDAAGQRGSARRARHLVRIRIRKGVRNEACYGGDEDQFLPVTLLLTGAVCAERRRRSGRARARLACLPKSAGSQPGVLYYFRLVAGNADWHELERGDGRDGRRGLWHPTTSRCRS